MTENTIYNELKLLEKRLEHIEEVMEPLKLIGQSLKERFIKEYKNDPGKIDYCEYVKFRIFESQNLDYKEKKLALFLVSKFDHLNHCFVGISHVQIRRNAHISTSVLSKLLQSLVVKGILIKEKKNNETSYKINALAFKRTNE